MTHGLKFYTSPYFYTCLSVFFIKLISKGQRFYLGQLRQRPTTMSQDEITHLLEAINAGDERAWQELMRLTYHQLYDIAHAQRAAKEEINQTFDTYAVVHEAYLSLYYSKQIVWQDRKHFYLTAAQAFRFALSVYHRDKTRTKRGGGVEHVYISEVGDLVEILKPESAEVLDAGLNLLEKKHKRAWESTMLRFFTGLREDEIAQIQGISTRTVIRDWMMAKAFLAKVIHDLAKPNSD